MLWLSKVAPVMLPTWLAPTDTWSDAKVRGIHQTLRKAVSERISYVRIEVSRSSQCEQRPRTALGRALGSMGPDYSAQHARFSNALQELETLDIAPPAGFPALIIEMPPVWEQPITNSSFGGRSFVVGFADMMIRYQRPYIALDTGDLSDSCFYDWLRSSRSLTQPSYFGWKSACAYFEVKTEIKSLGELMRQIQLYRNYSRGDWFVVSPDTRYVETLAEQGVRFVEYSPGRAGDIE